MHQHILIWVVIVILAYANYRKWFGHTNDQECRGGSCKRHRKGGEL